MLDSNWGHKLAPVKLSYLSNSFKLSLLINRYNLTLVRLATCIFDCFRHERSNHRFLVQMKNQHISIREIPG